MKSRRDKGRIKGLFVPLLIDTLDSPAWRALSHGAQCLYVALKRQHNNTMNNNGRIFLSQRRAQRHMRSNRSRLARWFRELQHYGFISQVSPGCLGLDGKGKAPHWRLTEAGTNLEPMPTRDFLRWNGTKFQPSKIQNPGPENGSTVDRKTGPLVVRKTGPLVAASGPQTGSIQPARGGPQNGSISRLTTPCAAEAEACSSAGSPENKSAGGQS
jgi:hypothetical protein